MKELLEGDDHAVGVDGTGGDERSFDDLVGVVAQDAAILERAGLAFGAVHDDGGGWSAQGVVGDRLPFPAGGEAGTAAPAQSRVEDGGDDLLRVHRLGGLQPAQSAGGPVLLERSERLGVQDAPGAVRWAAGRCAFGRSVSCRRVGDVRVDHGRGGRMGGGHGGSPGGRSGWAVGCTTQPAVVS